MLTYRCVFLGRDQRIIRAELIEAADDIRARERAEALCEVHHDCVGIELWDRARRVHVYQRTRSSA